MRGLLTLAIHPAKKLPMAFKLIKHIACDLILREAHQVVVLAAVVQIHLSYIDLRNRVEPRS